MALLANLALFFVFFVPLTLLVGIAGDLYVGRYQSPEEASQVFYWVVAGWPLFLPSVLIVPIAHIALAVARRLFGYPDPAQLRNIAIVFLPMGLLAIHLALWGTVVLSAPLLVSILFPGALFGWIARIPTTDSNG